MNNDLLGSLILINDTPDALILRNREKPTPIGSDQLFKTQREKQLDNIPMKSIEEELSHFCILSNKQIPKDELTPKCLFRYWDLTYPAEKESTHKNYFNKTLKKQIFNITEVHFSEFEKIDKSDSYKVATLCKRLSLLFERGLMLLAPDKGKNISIESRPYLPSNFSNETLLHSCFMSELFTELIYWKPNDEKGFLKNMDLALGNLWHELELLEVVPESISEIFSRKSPSIDVLSTNLVKSWVINERVAFHKISKKLDAYLEEYYSEENIYEGEPSGKFYNHAKTLWNHFLTSLFLRLQTMNENAYNVAFHFQKLIKDETNYIKSIELEIEKLIRLVPKLEAFVFGETSYPNSVLAKLEKFTLANSNKRSISINLEEQGHKTSLSIKCQFLDLTVIPEIHIKLWERIVSNALGINYSKPKTKEFVNSMCDWFRNNDVKSLKEDFEDIEKILGVLLIPRFQEDSIPVESFATESSIFMDSVPTVYIQQQFGIQYAYLKANVNEVEL